MFSIIAQAPNISIQFLPEHFKALTNYSKYIYTPAIQFQVYRFCLLVGFSRDKDTIIMATSGGAGDAKDKKPVCTVLYCIFLVTRLVVTILFEKRPVSPLRRHIYVPVP